MLLLVSIIKASWVKLKLFTSKFFIDPTNFHALNFMAAFFDKGEFNKSIQLLSEAVSLQTTNPDAFFNLGNAYRSAQRWEEAIPCYQKSSQLNGQHPESLNNLGLCFRELKNFTAAENAFQHALSLQPDFAGARLNLGNVFRDQGKNFDAISTYEKWIELNPASADAHFALGLVLIEVGEIERLYPALGKLLNFVQIAQICILLWDLVCLTWSD